MFYRFNAHKAAKAQTADPAKDRLAKQIAGKIRSLQQRWASLMSAQTAKIPPKWLKTLAIVLLVMAGSYCSYLIKDGLLSKPILENAALSKRWPFGYVQHNKPRPSQSVLARYLDSLQRELSADSLQNPGNYQR